MDHYLERYMDKQDNDDAERELNAALEAAKKRGDHVEFWRDEWWICRWDTNGFWFDLTLDRPLLPHNDSEVPF